MLFLLAMTRFLAIIALIYFSLQPSFAVFGLFDGNEQKPDKETLTEKGQDKNSDKQEKESKGHESAVIKLTEIDENGKKEKSKLESNKNSQEDNEVEKVRAKLKENEEKTLDFIFPNISDSAAKLESEKYFSKSEKEQLLELWRATLARNRTIQFIIAALSNNSSDQEKNNQIMQTLSRAMFVPFYALAAVSESSLITGGSAVGARVLGEVVDGHNQDKSQTRQITKTDLIVLFMLVDEVAERLRSTYQKYRNTKIERELIRFELEPARRDAIEAMEAQEKSAMFLTRVIVSDLEQRQRRNNLEFLSLRRTLIELAGDESVDALDVYIDLEIQEQVKDILGV
jgi:hypothetical protein